MKNRRLGMAACAALVLLAGGCGNSTAAGPGPAATVVVAEPAARRTIVSTLELTGTVEPERTARLVAQTEGEVVALAVREGDPVRSGQVLVQIDPSRLEAARAEARGERLAVEADLEDSRRVLARDRALFERRGLGQEALERSETTVRRLEAAIVRVGARIDGLEAQLADSRVTAPFDGYVLAREVELGDVVKGGTPLLAVASAGVRIVVHVSEIDLSRLDVGDPVSLVAGSGPAPCPGRIDRFRPQVDPVTRTAAVEVGLEGSCSARMLPGMLVRAGLTLERRAGVLAVPAEAVLTRPDGSQRLFVVHDGRAVERRVATGLEGEGWVEVSAGLEEGEPVVYEGQERLKEGTPVAVRAAGSRGRESA
jgi:membrane fusion protein, multidrug efflux system